MSGGDETLLGPYPTFRCRNIDVSSYGHIPGPLSLSPNVYNIAGDHKKHFKRIWT